MDPLRGFSPTNPNVVRDRLNALAQNEKPSRSEKIAQAAESAGFDPNKFEALRTDIRSAVDEALKGHKGTGSVRDTVQAAVGEVLSKHGIDPSTLQGPQLGQMGAAGKNPFAGFSAAQVEADALDMLFSSLTDSKDEEVKSALGDMFGRLPAGSLFDGKA